MASLPGKLLSSLAAVCATAGSPSALPEASVADLLRVAQVTADRLAGSAATADDLVGEAMLRLLQRHPDVLGGGKDRRGYVRQCIRNLYRDELRRRRRGPALSDLDGPDGTEWLSGLPAADEAQDLAAVEEFRSRLAAPERRVLDLLLAGHKDRAIAKLLERTRHDVRASLQAIRRAARRAFGDDAADGVDQESTSVERNGVKPVR